jgi:site-specific DNA-methyltransferase (adenine-specific)
MDVLLPKTSDHSDLYVFTANQVLKEWLGVTDQLNRHGYVRKGILIWEKTGPGQGDLESWGQSHEFIIYLKKGRRPLSGKRRSPVIHIDQVRPDKLIHPHEKPTALLEILLQASTERGDFVVDPFGGSGSLARAAKNIGRNAVAIEYDQYNYETSKKALEQDHAMAF